MKNKLFKSIVCLLGVFVLFSCSDEFLERQPLDREVSSNFYQTEDDAFEALVSIYDAFGYMSTPGVSWAPFVTVADILSDDAHAGGADANDGFEEEQLDKFLIQTNNPLAHSIYIKNYIGIYRANLLLENIDNIEASDEFKNRVIAECKFFRAYFYLEQVRFFENIPLLTETIKGPSEYSQEQNSPAEVYNQIASDLVDAAAGLPDIISGTDVGRVSRWAAKGLLARAYLFYNGVYGADMSAGSVTVDRGYALAELEDVINNSGHELLENYDELFGLSSEFGIESVLEISFGDTPAWFDWNYVRGGEGNLAAQMQGPRVTASDDFDRGWSFGTVSQKLVDDMAGDPRLSTTILFQDDIDGTVTEGYQHTGYFSNKYTSDAEHWSTDGQFELNRTCNFRVIRFSDILLMAAELGSPSAQQYLDRVRSRVGLESVPATMENIMKERRLEFALEGIRYFDIMRQGQSVAEREFTLNGVRGPDYTGDQALFDVNYNPATNGFLPIPQAEIDLSNGTLIQNGGY